MRPLNLLSLRIGNHPPRYFWIRSCFAMVGFGPTATDTRRASDDQHDPTRNALSANAFRTIDGSKSAVLTGVVET
jgi:hypothetical protein